MTSRNKIATILRTYADGEMHLNNAVKLIGGGLRTEAVIRQWMDGKLAFAETVSQIWELVNRE